MGSNCDKVKREIITQNTEKGGLKMIDLKFFITSLKCSWIKRIIKGGQSWLNFLEAVHGKNIDIQISDFGDDFINKLLKENKNYFWRDTFLEWQKIMKKQLRGKCV